MQPNRRHVTEDFLMANKYIRKYSMSSYPKTKDKKLNAKLHYTPTRTAKIQ